MSELSLQAGEGSLDGSLDPKLGIVALRIKCWAPDLLTAINGTVPGVGVGLVENQPRTFSRNVSGDQGGYNVLVTLEGHQAPEEADGEEFSLDGTTSEDPIESHPDILELIEKYGGTRDDQTGRVTFPLNATEPGAEDTRNPMHGVSSYLVPGSVWTHVFVSRTFPASLARALGKIDRPTSNAGQTPPDEGDRNWLNIRFTAAWRGNIWKITRSWLLSGPGGWNPDVYRYK